MKGRKWQVKLLAGRARSTILLQSDSHNCWRKMKRFALRSKHCELYCLAMKTLVEVISSFLLTTL